MVEFVKNHKSYVRHTTAMRNRRIYQLKNVLASFLFCLPLSLWLSFSPSLSLLLSRSFRSIPRCTLLPSNTIHSATCKWKQSRNMEEAYKMSSRHFACVSVCCCVHGTFDRYAQYYLRKPLRLLKYAWLMQKVIMIASSYFPYMGVPSRSYDFARSINGKLSGSCKKYISTDFKFVSHTQTLTQFLANCHRSCEIILFFTSFCRSHCHRPPIGHHHLSRSHSSKHNISWEIIEMCIRDHESRFSLVVIEIERDKSKTTREEVI